MRISSGSAHFFTSFTDEKDFKISIHISFSCQDFYVENMSSILLSQVFQFSISYGRRKNDLDSPLEILEAKKPIHYSYNMYQRIRNHDSFPKKTCGLRYKW